MLKDITFGQFFPGESLLHKTDARFKIVILIVYLVLVLLGEKRGGVPLRRAADGGAAALLAAVVAHPAERAQAAAVHPDVHRAHQPVRHAGPDGALAVVVPPHHQRGAAQRGVYALPAAVAVSGQFGHPDLHHLPARFDRRHRAAALPAAAPAMCRCTISR